MANDPLADMARHYATGTEVGRLQRPRGKFEFLRQCEIVMRALPEPPGRVADIGGGPGAYARWLASLGYRVMLRDNTPLHLDQARTATAGHDVDIAFAEAQRLDLGDASVDALLLFGPLYHLVTREERAQALREAFRVLRPGGPLFAVAISRWAATLDGGYVKRLYLQFPQFWSALNDLECSGYAPPLFEGDFTGYFHTPEQLITELRSAGFVIEDVVGVEGLSFALTDLDERCDNAADFEALFSLARRIERVPELPGLGPHLLATARRPA